MRSTLIQNNKNQLDEYLSEFHPDKIESIKLKFEEKDFDCGYTLFRYRMKLLISMPQMNRSSIRYWTERGWTEDEAKEKRTKIKVGKDKSPMSKIFWINKGMSEEQAEFETRSQRKIHKEYWIKRGYTEEESLIKISEFQKVNSNIYNSKYKNNEKFRNSIKKKRSNSIEYWINLGFSNEESKLKQSERQSTFTLEKCVERHGELVGKKVWKDRQIKWNSSLLNNGNLKIGYSNISQILFDEICLKLDNDQIYYGKKNKEFCLANGKNGFLYDFTDLLNKKIIEFNGDIYHGNPLIYNENDKPNPFKDLTCNQLWQKDKIKIDLAKENGFDVLVIWESEYKKDKELIVKRCLNFLTNKN